MQKLLFNKIIISDDLLDLFLSAAVRAFYGCGAFNQPTKVTGITTVDFSGEETACEPPRACSGYTEPTSEASVLSITVLLPLGFIDGAIADAEPQPTSQPEPPFGPRATARREAEFRTRQRLRRSRLHNEKTDTTPIAIYQTAAYREAVERLRQMKRRRQLHNEKTENTPITIYQTKAYREAVERLRQMKRRRRLCDEKKRRMNKPKFPGTEFLPSRQKHITTLNFYLCQLSTLFVIY